MLLIPLAKNRPPAGLGDILSLPHGRQSRASIAGRDSGAHRADIARDHVEDGFSLSVQAAALRRGPSRQLRLRERRRLRRSMFPDQLQQETWRRDRSMRKA
jgi:hypothetical protein